MVGGPDHRDAGGEVSEHDAAGFEAFCREAWPRLVGALGHLTGDRAVAEELAQEALARAHQRWTRVSQLASPLGWTVHVGANLARSHLRRTAVARRHAAVIGPDRGTHQDPDGAEVVAVRDALARLTPAQREAVVLRHVLGLTAVETGEVLGVAATVVRARTKRGLDVLRTHLAIDEPHDVEDRDEEDDRVR
ncbi:sigma-70 family RNA polymerase sigma factor [Nitriliruptoraceae bacterium ZYF776]|nr:sigma-70 family RNA polymerase sigma factor [Profundirhabdus halotolerans]